jgi:hypothetical protein
MTLSMTAGSILTAMEIDNALVRINTALSGLRCHRHGQHDAEIETAVHEARQLKLYLEHNPSASTPAALRCCEELLTVRST